MKWESYEQRLIVCTFLYFLCLTTGLGVSFTFIIKGYPKKLEARCQMQMLFQYYYLNDLFLKTF